jgi:hypothetical protein
MFTGNLKLLVYSMVDEETREIITASKLQVAPNLQSLYRYLIDNKFIVESLILTRNIWDFSARRTGKITIRRPWLGSDGHAGGEANHQTARIFWLSGA